MKKRKIIAGLLIASAALSLASCDNKEKPANPDDNNQQQTTTYTVTFNSVGGSTVASITVDASGKITLPTNPTKEGFTFKGWYLDEVYATEFKITDAITANITLFAKWEAIVVEETTYEVVFDGAEVAIQDIKAGEKVTKPADPTKEGYVFDGWYKDSIFRTEWNFDTDTVNEDIKIYAKWIKDSTANQTNPIEMNGVAYDTVAAAIAAIPTSGDTSTYTIRLNKGTYNEKGLSYNGSATIRIVGNTNTKYGTDVIIKGRGNDMSSMRGRELLEIQGTGSIILENLSLVSDYSRSESSKDAQAEVLGTDTKGNTVAYNCSFISHQDTLRTAGKAWFYGCYVEGDTDFIWMEAAGSVALYENCEIVSVYDQYAGTHTSYVAAPRMGVSSKVGKGLVFLNSVVRESEEAKAKGQVTYLARSPWTKDFYNQVAYINTICSDIETTSSDKAPNAPWYDKMIETEYPQSIIGWKMDSKTAASLNLTGKDYIVDDAVTSKEFSGRKTILNRIYNTGKLKYEKDTTNNWDIDALIKEYGYIVSADSSSDVVEGEVAVEPTVYKFDGNTDYSTICNGFVQDNAKPHFVGNAGNTITIPVNGKCFVEVYGYYAGTAEVQADTQGYSITNFNNGSTNTEIEHDYIVYDANAKKVVITAKATTYITKIVVIPDATIEDATPVSSIEIERSSKVETVGVSVTLSASVNKDATNKAVVWSSSDTTVAEINQYNGRITFKKAGKVVFTATACDGSGVTQTIECNPKDANWTACEWYTTDTDITTEAGAEGFDNFVSAEASAYKSLGSVYTFTNLAGQTITTERGFKLNSKGELSIAVTRAATLTITTCEAGKVFATPVVSNGTTAATLISSTEATDGKTITYVYKLSEAGMWTIVRGDNATENNPILYVKCEYPVLPPYTSDYSYVFAKEANNYDAAALIESNKYVTFVGCKKHDDTYIALKENNSVTVKVAAGSILTVNMPYSSGVTLNGEAYTLDANNNLVYTAKEDEDVVITGAAGNAYITSITVVAAPKYTGDYSYVFSNVAANYTAQQAIESTDFITFAGCQKHDDTYIALKENNSITVKVAAGSTLTVNMPYSSGVTLNGEPYELDSNNNLTYSVKEDTAVVITGTAGNAYITSITVEKTKNYATSYSYVFSDVAANYAAQQAIESTEYVTFVGCQKHDDTYIALKENNSITVKVAAGYTVVVNMPFSGGVTLNGEAYTLDANNNLIYTATTNQDVVITGTAGNAYITSIIVKIAE